MNQSCAELQYGFSFDIRWLLGFDEAILASGGGEVNYFFHATRTCGGP